MNKTINKFLLTGNKFMPEMQPRFTYSVCGPFTCFQHGIAYGDFKDLPRRTAIDRILRGKAFNLAKNAKHDGYQRGLASMVSTFFSPRKPFFCLSLNFLNVMLEIRLSISYFVHNFYFFIFFNCLCS